MKRIKRERMSQYKKGRLKQGKCSTLRRMPIPDRKLKVIRIRVQDRVYYKIKEKAAKYTNGNVSQFVRFCIIKELR
jgi:hypothetical protein